MGPVTLASGEAIVSLRLLEKAWGWHRGMVIRFLKALKNDTTISTTNETTFTRVKVLNWKRYQGSEHEDDTTNDTANSTTHSTTRDTTYSTHPKKEEAKKVKKKEGGPLATPSSSPTKGASPPVTPRTTAEQNLAYARTLSVRQAIHALNGPGNEQMAQDIRRVLEGTVKREDKGATAGRKKRGARKPLRIKKTSNN